ncbi:hypothetical protein AN403_3025 [Pseudomonas fluorescens]|uniref:Uncharacterized protein n=2 Tax=Pseudomonas fluorescens TaxID=294 RepID=A0A0P8X1D9_PSEFL|nr:hypothetical protein AN403_3025 [Pseudomonas fluorescens]
MARGVHYSIFQYLLIKQCPIHQIDLTQACRTCGGAMDYFLSSKLFKVTYGCYHCGRLLRRKEGHSGLSYLNKSGFNRLILAHKIFDHARDKRIYFDINQPTNVYFDNVAQFSSAIKDFAVNQRVLFDEVQAYALSGFGKKSAGYYIATNTINCSPARKFLKDLAVEEFVPVLKCIFRHIRKRFFPEVRLSRNRLAGMWRSFEGCEIYRDGYHSASYLDWLCFWYGVKVPADLLSKANRCVIRKLSAWLESKRAHEVFSSLKGGREKNWLVLKIFSHEVIFFMAKQLKALDSCILSGCAIDSRRLVYRREVGPAAWALVILPNASDCEFHFSARPSLIEISRQKNSALQQKATTASLSL